jgi:hypothetical protein
VSTDRQFVAAGHGGGQECVELDGDVVEGAGAASLLATAIEEGRDLSSMSGILADRSYRLLPA